MHGTIQDIFERAVPIVRPRVLGVSVFNGGSHDGAGSRTQKCTYARLIKKVQIVNLLLKEIRGRTPHRQTLEI